MVFNPNNFVKLVKSISGRNLFNPYTQLCPHNDDEGSQKSREINLIKYLEVVKNSDSILIGEAPGYLGCRRTGLPFTDNRHLPIVENIYGLEKLEIATQRGKDKENSALYMWRVIRELTEPPFVWNLIPLHPYKPDNQLSNRTPVKSDYYNTKKPIQYLLKEGGFKTILAVGRVAEKHITDLGYDCSYVRHPSHGGANIFANQVRKHLD